MFKGKPTGQTSSEQSKETHSAHDLRQKLHSLKERQRYLGERGTDILASADISHQSNEILLAILQTQIETLDLLKELNGSNEE